MRGKARGRGRGRGSGSTRGRGSVNKRRGSVRKKKDTRKHYVPLTRPKTLQELLSLLRDADQKSHIEKLLVWYAETFYDPAHIQLFTEITAVNPEQKLTLAKSEAFSCFLNAMEQINEDPIEFLRAPLKKKCGMTKGLHQNLCVSVFSSIESHDQLHEAIAVISKTLKTKVVRAFWQRHKADGSAWCIDQSTLPEAMKRRKLQKFDEYVMGLIQKKDVSTLQKLVKAVPNKFEGIVWSWGYSQLMYASRVGGAEVAKVFLAIQKEPEIDREEQTFLEFLEMECPKFIKVYDEWLTDFTAKKQVLSKASKMETSIGFGCVIF